MPWTRCTRKVYGLVITVDCGIRSIEEASMPAPSD